MRKITALLAGLALAMVAMPAPAALADDIPPNAIVSEGNGAAVFIGYGGDRTVDLAWRPSKKYEDATMLYQVQRSDGAMLESKTRAASLTDRNLQPNTNYTYRLTVFQSIVKTFTVNGEDVKRTITKRVGTNAITVLTLPTMVVGLTATTAPATPGVINVNWQPPQNAVNSPITYSVLLDDNVMAYGLTVFSYTLTGVTNTKAHSVKVVSENAAGQAKANATITNVKVG